MRGIYEERSRSELPITHDDALPIFGKVFLFATCELYKQMFDILTCCFSLVLVEEAGEVLPFACDLVGTSRLLAVEDCVAEVDAEGG